MMSRAIAVIVATSIPLAAFAQQCYLSGATPMPANSTWSAGPNVYAGHVANPLIGADIYAARDAWDATTAVNRIGDWNGLVSASDCPIGLPMQIGAFDFNTVSCATNTAYGVSPTGTLAYVDYFAWACAGCGTKSLTVNLAFSWAVGTTPLAGQYDLQSVLAHEFGHMLGLGHMSSGACVHSSPSCAGNPGLETMGATFYPGPGETCQRTTTGNDGTSAQGLY